MEKYTRFIIKYKKTICFVFLVLMLLCAFLSFFVGVDYDFADYLPDDAASTKALDLMNEEYDQAIPNMRVMMYDLDIPTAMAYKEKLSKVDGVEEVNWLDDAVEIKTPLEMADSDITDTWYKNNNPIYQLTIDEEKQTEAVKEIRKIIGNKNCMSGAAVTAALSPINSAAEIQKITVLAVVVVFIILFLTTNSWFEPFLFMITIGVAIMLNRGTNLIFGTISFVTNAAGSVLQLACSMDYSIFLLNRFAENRKTTPDIETAMTDAIKQSAGSVLSSGLTTVSGFAALVLMKFKIGPDMGWVMAKAICFSLICVLCLLPSLTMCCYKWIDKTQHKSFIPPFHKFTNFAMKARIPLFAIAIILLIPCFNMQQNNDFLYGDSQVYSSNQTQIGRDMNAINKEYGISNTLVLLVPKGDLEKENELNDELKSVDYVDSVISYANSVGTMIPDSFIPSDTLSKLYSKNYSRYVITVDTAESDSSWFEKVEKIKKIGEKYYPGNSHCAGSLSSTADLKTTIQKDTITVNALAIGFVFIILLFNFKSICLPIILTIVIEASIWMNLSFPYIQGSIIFYIGYLIISSVQLGATIDYGILFTNRYLEYRNAMKKRDAIKETIFMCSESIITSASILTICGFILGKISTNGVLSQLGILIGRGTIISFVMVLFVLPTCLMAFDKIIEITTLHTTFFKEESI